MHDVLFTVRYVVSRYGIVERKMLSRSDQLHQTMTASNHTNYQSQGATVPCAGELKSPNGFSRGAADDYVYPVHLLDGAKYQHCILTLFIRFNDLLDADKLRDGLTRLLEIGDWKKLGGRFRTKVDESIAPHDDYGNGDWKAGMLEIHVPKKYTAERPAIQFALENHGCNLSEHIIGSRFPRTSNEGVMLSEPVGDLKNCGLGPGFATTMEDLVDKDVPQLGFKAINFLDATVFTVTFSHCTWDISGLQGFMKSLELVLDGRDDEVQPMLGAREDVLSKIAAQYDGTEFNFGLLSRSVNLFKKSMNTAPKTTDLEERVLRVPLDILQKLHKVVTIENNGDDDDDHQSLYQPDELFLALLMQQIARSQPVPCPLKMLNIYNARLLVPHIAQANGIYSQNLVVLAPQVVPSDVARGPLAQLAVDQRECFAQCAVPKNLAQSIYTILGAIEADIDITGLVGSGAEDNILVNNLVKLSSYIDVDFTSAVVRQGESSATRKNGLGTAEMCFLTLPGNSYGMKRVTTVGSYNGNSCWVFGELPRRAWEMIYDALDALEL